MEFIGQIEVPGALGVAGHRIAYVFMTVSQTVPMAATWEPDTGENAVILQPGLFEPITPVLHLRQGPSVKSRRALPRSFWDKLRGLRPQTCVDAEYTGRESDVVENEHTQSLSRLGGHPHWIQEEAFPTGGDWKFLAQLDSITMPIEVGFGDSGTAYIFVSTDGRHARMLWQSC